MPENEEFVKKVIDWMKQNVEPDVEDLNILAIQETKEIYTGSRNLLVATLIGVFIGVLTNISAEYLISGEILFGSVTLLLSILIAVISFFVWRFYLVRDLQKYIRKSFYERGKSIKEKFEKDFGISEDKSN